MAERKKRGLGRGLGALIPDANSSDRPVDVFFSGGNGEDGKSEGEHKTSRTARTDPAASMQSSRRRKPKAGSAVKTENEAKSSDSDSSKSSTAKTAKSSTASTSPKTAAKTTTKTAAKTTASKSAGATGSSSKTAAGKTSSGKPARSSSTTKSTGGTKSTKTAAGATKSASGTRSTTSPSTTAAASSNAVSGSSNAASVPKTTTAADKDDTPAGKANTAADKSTASSKKDVGSKTVEPQKTAGSPASDQSTQIAESSPNAVADTQAENPDSVSSTAESSSDVRETHPGVYTSSGYDPADSKADQDEGNEDTDNVSTTTVVDTADSDASGDEVAASSDAASADDESSTSEDSAAAGDEEADPHDGVESIPDTEFGEIDVDLIDANPRQPRTVFDEDLLAELVHSIREIGVLQPVVVRQKPSDRSRFELIMGERRLRATKDAGLPTIPAIIRYVEDTDLLRDALLENLHRAELNPLEEAAAYGQLLEDFGCTQEELSERIGRSRPQISNTLRLLRLPPLVQRRVAAGVISAGHARAILGLREPEHMEVLAQRIVAEGLSVRASEEAVVLLNRGDSVNVSRATTKVSPEFIAVAERLGDRLDTKVNISVGKRKGKLSVEFANQEDLDRILGLLGISGEEDG